MPSPVLAEAVQPVTALPTDAIIPKPVLPLALQLLIVLEAPAEIPPRAILRRSATGNKRPFRTGYASAGIEVGHYSRSRSGC